MRRTLLVFILAFLLLAPVVSAAEPDEVEAEVKIRPTAGYTTQQILFFPLQIPRYVLRSILWPIGATIQIARRQHLTDALAKSQKNFFWQPYIVFGGGGAFGVGIKFLKEDLFGTGYNFRAYAQSHTNRNHRAGLSLEDKILFNIFGRPVGYKIITRYRNEGNRRFFGIGNNTPESNESEYSYYKIRGGVVFDYNFLHTMHLQPHILFHASKTTSKRGNQSTSTQNVFPASTIPGFGQWLNHFDIGFHLTHDSRDNENVPARGGYYRAGFRRMQGIDVGKFSYNEFTLDLRQYIPLWAPRRVLTLRASTKFQQATGGSQIPFNRLANLGLSAPLRGFRTGRFSDTSYILFNVEYRYPIWTYVDAVAFVDTGRVFDGLNNISLKNIKYSAGGGLWLVTKKFYFLRFEVAYGGEGVQAFLKADRAI